jgi:PTS system mannose-specific IIA component
MVAASEPRPAPLGLLVVTHGGLAFELVRAQERILGSVEGVRALSLGWDDDLAAARRAVQDAIGEVDAGAGVLILTDMFGGTPTNVALSFLREGVEIVTGVNLPMVVKFAGLRMTCSLKEAAARVRDQGQRSIALATDYLEPSGRG